MKINIYGVLFLFICFCAQFCTKTKTSPSKKSITPKKENQETGHETIYSCDDKPRGIVPKIESEGTSTIQSVIQPANKSTGTFKYINNDTYNCVDIDYKKFKKCIINNWDLIKNRPGVKDFVKDILQVNMLIYKKEGFCDRDITKELIIGKLEELRKGIRNPISKTCLTRHDFHRIREMKKKKKFRKGLIEVPEKKWIDVCQELKDLVLYRDLKEHNIIISEDDSMKEKLRILTGDPVLDSKISPENINKVKEKKNENENCIIELESTIKDLIRAQLDKYAKKYSFKFLDKYKISLGYTSEEGAYRENMEDGHTFVKSKDGNICIFGVFDGHGGREISYKLQEDFGQYILGGIQRSIDIKGNFDDKEFEDVIQKLFLEYDKKKLYQERQKYYKAAYVGKTENEKERLYEEVLRPGSTVTLAIIIKDRLFLVNLGDSRIVVLQNGKIIKTKDHKPNDGHEKKRIINSGGCVEKGRINGILNVSRAMGDFGLKLLNLDGSIKNYEDIEYKDMKYIEYENMKEKPMKDLNLIISPIPTVDDSISISKSTSIILACDGIWDRMSIKEIKDLLEKYEKSHCKDLSKYLVHMSEERNDTYNCGDNMTCMVLKIKSLK